MEILIAAVMTIVGLEFLVHMIVYAKTGRGGINRRAFGYIRYYVRKMKKNREGKCSAEPCGT